jgi:hypothetical protein
MGTSILLAMEAAVLPKSCSLASYSQACADTKPDASGFVSAGLVLCHQTEPSLEGKMVTVSGPGT